MTEKEYKKRLKESEKALKRIFSELVKGNGNFLHYVISGKVRDYVLTEMAKLRGGKVMDYKMIADRKLGGEVDFLVSVQTDNAEYEVSISLIRVLENLSWVWKAKRPIVKKVREIQKPEKPGKSNEPVEMDMTESIEKEEKKVSDGKAGQNPKAGKRGAGKVKK